MHYSNLIPADSFTCDLFEQAWAKQLYQVNQ